MHRVSDHEAQQLHKQILRHFATVGKAPACSEIEVMADGASPRITEEHLKVLEKWGALYRDPRSQVIRAAYPFSGVPTSHHVKLSNGVEVYAMCAIDALGIPFMLDTDATIRSVCHQCGTPITVTVEKYAGVSAEPSDLVVWYATNETCCVAAVDLCPHLNFFCSPKDLTQWRERNPGQKGKVLSLAEAIDRGREVFGSLLKGEVPT